MRKNFSKIFSKILTMSGAGRECGGLKCFNIAGGDWANLVLIVGLERRLECVSGFTTEGWGGGGGKVARAAAAAAAENIRQLLQTISGG